MDRLFRVSTQSRNVSMKPEHVLLQSHQQKTDSTANYWKTK